MKKDFADYSGSVPGNISDFTAKMRFISEFTAQANAIHVVC